MQQRRRNERRRIFEKCIHTRDLRRSCITRRVKKNCKSVHACNMGRKSSWWNSADSSSAFRNHRFCCTDIICSCCRHSTCTLITLCRLSCPHSTPNPGVCFARGIVASNRDNCSRRFGGRVVGIASSLVLTMTMAMVGQKRCHCCVSLVPLVRIKATELVLSVQEPRGLLRAWVEKDLKGLVEAIDVVRLAGKYDDDEDLILGEGNKGSRVVLSILVFCFGLRSI